MASVPEPVGPHWQGMGFNGIDPAEELNASGGILAVVHMFFFFCRSTDVFTNLFQLSQETRYSFQFARVSLNITELVVESLLSGSLSKLCNASKRGVFDMTCEAYTAAFLNLAEVWQQPNKRKMGAGDVLREVRIALDKNPTKFISKMASWCGKQDWIR